MSRAYPPVSNHRHCKTKPRPQGAFFVSGGEGAWTNPLGVDKFAGSEQPACVVRDADDRAARSCKGKARGSSQGGSLAATSNAALAATDKRGPRQRRIRISTIHRAASPADVRSVDVNSARPCDACGQGQPNGWPELVARSVRLHRQLKVCLRCHCFGKEQAQNAHLLPRKLRFLACSCLALAASPTPFNYLSG